jgi:hypothetical protein
MLSRTLAQILIIKMGFFNLDCFFSLLLFYPLTSGENEYKISALNKLQNILVTKSTLNKFKPKGKSSFSPKFKCIAA